MKSNLTAQKPSFWKWIHTYRLKIVAAAFIIIVPIALILSIYIGSFVNNRKIHFDQELTEETVMINDYIKVNPKNLDVTDEDYYQIESIDAFDLFIKWEEINKPSSNPTTGELEGGNYKFKVYYQAKDGYILNSVNVIPLLQTDWTDIRSLGNSLLLGTVPPTSAFLSVPFNFKLPVRPLLFVTVDTPNLYLKITFNQSVDGQASESKTVYVLYDLDQINPKAVYPIS